VIHEFRSTLRAASAVAFLAIALLAGCACQGCGLTDEGGPPIERGAAPSFEEVALKYNARVAGLDRLWARTTVRYWGVDGEGKKVDEAGEGYLQLIRPRRLFFSVGKVGETGFQLGSDDSRYWWIDVQNKSATVGTHARATPDVLSRSGVPVHPLDLIEVLGVTELVRAPGVRGPEWTSGGRRLQVAVPGRWGGTRAIFLDPERFEPVEIQLLDSAGKMLARAELSEYASIETPRESAVPARLATRAMISVPPRKSEIRLTLFDPENKGARILDRSFQFERLAKEYSVERIRELDALGDARRAPPQ